MKNNKGFVAVIALLLLSNFFTYTKVGRLEDEISQVNNTLYRMDNSIRDISEAVSWELDQFMIDNAWTRSARAEAVSYNNEDKTVGVEVQVAFNELGNDEDMIILVQDEAGKEVDRIEATSLLNGSLNLNADLNLDLGQDYKLSIIGQSAELKRSQDLGWVRLKNIMADLLYVHGFGWELEVDDQDNYTSIGLNIMVESDWTKNPFIREYMKDREIVDLYGEIQVNGHVYDTIDFMAEEGWHVTEELNHVRTEDDQTTLPAFTPGIMEQYNLDIDGTYIFVPPVSADSQVDFYVVFTDSQGDTYRYPLDYVFE